MTALDLSVVKEKMTTADVNAALIKHFPDTRFVTMFDVANATGAGAARRADLLVQALWPSDGLGLLGIEVKVSRSDWQRERVDPGKSLAFAKYCDEFALCAPKGVCLAGELPPGWGLLLYSGGALRWSVRPETRTPEPLPLTLRAAMLRAAAKGPESVSLMRQAIERDVRTQLSAVQDGRLKIAQDREREAAATLKELRDACGAYSLWQVNAAVELLDAKGVDAVVAGLRLEKSRIARRAEIVDRVIAALEEVPS